MKGLLQWGEMSDSMLNTARTSGSFYNYGTVMGKYWGQDDS